MASTGDRLRSLGIQPSPQRMAVAKVFLGLGQHQSADQVLERARKTFPRLSRATVYNTLHLFAARGEFNTASSYALRAVLVNTQTYY